MNLGHTRELVNTHGLSAGLHDLTYRAVNKVTDVMVLRALRLTPEAVQPGCFASDPAIRWGFVDRSTLLEQVRARPLDMDEAFVQAALDRGDRCFGAISEGTLVSYGWYSSLPTPVTEDLTIHFNPAHAYMYKAYTSPAHRGKRLHGTGMGMALGALAQEGSQGLLSYVRSNNFASLRSCFRLGYQDIGVLVAVKMGQRFHCYASPGCRPFDFRLEPELAPRGVGALAPSPFA